MYSRIPVLRFPFPIQKPRFPSLSPLSLLLTIPWAAAPRKVDQVERQRATITPFGLPVGFCLLLRKPRFPHSALSAFAARLSVMSSIKRWNI